MAVAFVLLACTSCSTSNPYGSQIDPTWNIDALNVTIDVGKDRTAKIEEEFFITFTGNYKHGMYRDFAVNSGEKYRDVKVEEGVYTNAGSRSLRPVRYGFERGTGFLSVKIGSEDITYMSGESVCFVISYTLIPPKKTAGDVYYFNAVGPAFSTAIDAASIELTMPDVIDSGATRFYVGDYDSPEESPVLPLYTNGGKTVSVSGIKLKAYQGVTADVTLPKGTFGSYLDSEFYFTLFIGLALLIATLALKLTKGKSKPIVPITNYYPPKDEQGRELSPVRLGMLIDNTCESEDVTSLIFYWASKGYLRLSEQGSDMEITLVKPLPADAPDYERVMYDKLYSMAKPVEREEPDPFDGKQADPFAASADPYLRRVCTSSLKEKFYNTVTAVKQGVQGEYKGKLYSRGVNTLSGLMGILSAVFIVAMVMLAYMRISWKYFNVWGFLAAVPVFIVYFIGQHFAMHYLKYAERRRKTYLVLYIIASFAAMGAATFFISADAMGVLEKILLMGLTGLASAVAPFITRRTEYYTSVLGDVIGFKEFLTLAEKDKLEMMLRENPQYYYDILPYANVLGVSEIWEKKFKDLAVPAPTYWDSDVVFTMILFNSFYRRSYTGFRTASVSRPSSNGRSGGGFGGGGGGHVGGGFGGGGGRSW